MFDDIAVTVLILIVLLIISGFFSGAETAFTATSARTYLDAKRGDKRAIILLKLKSRMERLIAAILLGNNFVNILASSIATSVLIGLFGKAGVVYATLIMTMMILIFAEILPKTIAVKYADVIAVRIASFMRVLLFMLMPIIWLIEGFLWLFLRPFGLHLSHAPHNDDEHHTEILRGAIEMHDQAVPSDADKKMLHSILDLDDVNVSKVMTHRSEVTILDLEDTVKDMVEKVSDSPYSRFPLVDGDIEEIIGVVNAKQLLSEFRRHKNRMGRKDLLTVASKPWFVPESALIKDQLKSFQERREHFSVVVDEYGVFLGVITLEDVLEEIVGNIVDESDSVPEGIELIDGNYIIEGNMPIRDLNREMGWDLPDENATTIAGLVMYEARILPKKDQVFAFFNFRFKILKVARNRVLSVQITPPQKNLDS